MQGFLDLLVREHVETPLKVVPAHLKRAQAPYLPLTIGVYREVAYKKVKQEVVEKLKAGVDVKVEKIATDFVKKIDLEILN